MGKESGAEVGLGPAPRGGTEAGVRPRMGWCFRTEGTHLMLSGGHTADLRQVERNEDHTGILATAPTSFWTRTQVPPGIRHGRERTRAQAPLRRPQGTRGEAIRLWGEAGRHRGRAMLLNRIQVRSRHCSLCTGSWLQQRKTHPGRAALTPGMRREVEKDFQPGGTPSKRPNAPSHRAGPARGSSNASCQS